MKIQPDTAAIKKEINIGEAGVNSTLAIIGDLTGQPDTVIEQPKVMEPDESNDDHWQPAKYNSEGFILNENTTLTAIPFKGKFRINKPETTVPQGFIITV